MAKLYPPIIEGTLPAVAENAGSAILTIPFLMNKAVSDNDFDGMVVQIKSSGLNNKIIGTVKTSKDNIAFTSNKVEFDLISLGLEIGQFYKAQVAYYEGEENIGYYSTVGVFKYTGGQILGIEGLASGETATNIILPFPKFTYAYGTSIDPSEKIYAYKFEIEQNGKSYISSDWIINDNLNGDCSWRMPCRLVGESTAQCVARTINNLEIKSNNYEIKPSSKLSDPCPWDIKLDINQENACRTIVFTSKSSATFAKTVYIIQNNQIKQELLLSPNVSYNIMDFDLTPDNMKTKYSIIVLEEGVDFWEIQLDNDNKNSLSLEHSYLFDGERQLKIKYNPKISSFKPTILEQKINTIGSKYPFFYTNGEVNYKEFPISGLLSYLSDEEGLFDPKYAIVNLVNRDKTQSNSNNWNNNIGSTQLTSENIELERQFKMEVLDFLTSGKPMLFRSPTEGNYIVRLSGVSLSPNDTLGRMLHTFSATATECAEYNIENLNKYGLAIKEV